MVAGRPPQCCTLPCPLPSPVFSLLVLLKLCHVPGDGFRRRHDALVDVVFRSAFRAGLPGRTEPRRLFMPVLPQDMLGPFPSLAPLTTLCRTPASTATPSCSLNNPRREKTGLGRGHGRVQH